MKQSIKEHFQFINVPKSAKVTINENDITIVSTNTNYYTLGAYGFFFAIIVAISLAFAKLYVLIVFGIPFVVLAAINFYSRVVIKLTNEFIEIKDGFFVRHFVPVGQIESITFGGTTNTGSSEYMVGNYSSTSNVCTHIMLKSGKTLDVIKSAENQKFMFRCLGYFIEAI